MTLSDSTGDAVTIGQEADAERYTATTGIQRGGARPRAKASLAPLPSASGRALTDGDHPASAVQLRAQGFADSLAARMQARLAVPPLPDAHTLSLREGRDRVHAAAACQSVPVLAVLRIVYGYLHLLWGLACDAAKEIPRSPWGLVIAAAVVFVLIHW